MPTLTRVLNSEYVTMSNAFEVLRMIHVPDHEEGFSTGANAGL